MFLDKKFKPEVTFYEKDHKYLVNKTGERLISVTQLIGEYVKPVFDPTGEITAKYAKKHNKTVEQVQTEWNTIKEDSCTKGTAAHKDVEDFFKTGQINKNENQYYVSELAQYYPPPHDNIHSEKLLYSLKYKIAGTADIIEEIDNNLIGLGDLKTNKKIDTYNRYGNKLRPPFDHLYETELNVYAFQLGIYKKLLEEVGYWVKDLKIFHINYKKEKLDVYDVPFFEDEIDKLLDIYKKV